MLDPYAHSIRLQDDWHGGVWEGDVGRLVGVRVRRMRRTLGKSLGALAREAGVHRNTLSKIEGGKVARPRAHTLGKVAGALGVGMEDLCRPLGRPGPRSPIGRLMEASGSLAEEDLDALARIAATIPPTSGFIADGEGKMERVRYRIDLASRYLAVAAARGRAGLACLEQPTDDAAVAFINNGDKRALLRDACEALSGRELDPLVRLACHLLGGKLVLADAEGGDDEGCPSPTSGSSARDPA